MRELELRGKLTENEYRAASKALSLNSKPLENNKMSQFFVFTNGILKVSLHESLGKTVLSLKIGDESSNELHEYEVKLGGDEDFDKCVDLIEALGYRKRELVRQQRVDYELGDVVISLKYTEDWGYHFEAEKLISDTASAPEARSELEAVCDLYGLKYMSPNELATFLESIKH